MPTTGRPDTLGTQQTSAPAVDLEVPVANVSDCMARMTAGGARLRPMHAGGRMAGPALTIKARPGDNLMIHKALDLAAPGDVVVVDHPAGQVGATVEQLGTEQ